MSARELPDVRATALDLLSVCGFADAMEVARRREVEAKLPERERRWYEIGVEILRLSRVRGGP